MKVGIANIFNSLFERIEKIAFGKNSAIINTIIEEKITSQKPTKKVNVEISISGSKFKINVKKSGSHNFAIYSPYTTNAILFPISIVVIKLD